MYLIIVLCLLIPTYFLWAAIHEYSHVIAYHLLYKVHSYSVKLYPHKHLGSFRFAGYSVWLGDPETKENKWKTALAPRVMDLVACFFFPFCLLFSGTVQLVLLTLVGGGLVDLFIGSLGIRKQSDLVKASDSLDIPNNVLRVWGLVLCSVPILTVVSMLCH